MINKDYDRGARDGNQDFPPTEPNNLEYMKGYEEGQRLADVDVPYIPLYGKDDVSGRRCYPDYEQISDYIRKDTHEER